MKSTSPAASQALRQRPGLGQRLLGPAELGEEGRAHAGDRERELGDPAPLAEVDPLPAGVERRLRPLVLPDGDREVVVQDGRGAALALLERERERPAHVLEPLPLAQVGAGRAAEAERRAPARAGRARRRARAPARRPRSPPGRRRRRQRVPASSA